MAGQTLTQLPLNVTAENKSDMRTQFAALCYRVKNDKPQVLLITSRGTERWILPKGWPMAGKTPAQVAKIEAWEEAGVKGRKKNQCLGLFSYYKHLDDGDKLPCVAMVYPVKVSSLAEKFPEKDERRREWFSPKKASKLVDEPELRKMLREFDPKVLR